MNAARFARNLIEDGVDPKIAQPLAGVVFVLDGVLIGAGDGGYLARAGLLVLVVFAPAAWLAVSGGMKSATSSPIPSITPPSPSATSTPAPTTTRA